MFVHSRLEPVLAIPNPMEAVALLKGGACSLLLHCCSSVVW